MSTFNSQPSPMNIMYPSPNVNDSVSALAEIFAEKDPVKREILVHAERKRVLSEQLTKDGKGLVMFPSEETGFSTIIHTVGLGPTYGFDLIAVTLPCETADYIFELAEILNSKKLEFPLVTPVEILNEFEVPALLVQLPAAVAEQFAKNAYIHGQVNDYNTPVLQLISGKYDPVTQLPVYDVLGKQDLINRPLDGLKEQVVYVDEKKLAS